MLETAARDGPLLNFCKLGHLGVMAVPFKGSGLEDTDNFKKLLDLLQKMTDDPRLPLTLASPRVWEDLGRLREEVFDICAGSNNKDEENMQDLLEKIDAIYQHRPSSTQEHRPNDHVQSQASGTSAVVQSNPFRGQTPANGRSSYASSSTTVVEDRHDGSPAREDGFRGVSPAPNNHRGEIPNLYSTPYPLLPSQIGPGGAIAHPLSASFLPTLSPSAGSTEASPGIPTIQHPLPYMRYNNQHHQAPVYYPPRRNTRSATLSSSSPPTRMLSAPSNRWLGSSSSNGVYSSTPPASPVHEGQ
ncbi:hypothetical protein EDB85DRAFT_1923421 [Lactarius pseudohatsudake]|nr:hypothetical protein EDB85DRAFT_1923421 [Lactarius pseudohatsudake]